VSTLTDAPAWHAQAACRGEDRALFHDPRAHEHFTVRRDREQSAIEVCSTCTVRQVCLDDALSDDLREQVEVRGGLTAEQRRTTIKERAAAANAGIPLGRTEATRPRELLADMRAAGHTLAAIADAGGVTKKVMEWFAYRHSATMATSTADAITAAHEALMSQGVAV